MAGAHDFDVVVIGAGIAGMVSAVTATGLGKRVAVVEKQKVGGNCTNFTCIPSKTLIRLSHTNREITRLASLGLLGAEAKGLCSRQVMGHIRSVVAKAYEKDVPETFERMGITMLLGPAAFVDRHRIDVNGRIISGAQVIIAAGTRPLVPPIPGIAHVPYLTNESLYELDDLPESLIILGGGVDGLEYASAFGRLGVETTVIELGTRFLPNADRELVKHLTKALTADGIRLLSGAKATAMSTRGGKVVLTYELAAGNSGEVTADRVLIALGRKPDLEGLALDKAGVNHNRKGILTDNTLRTSAPNIYACGDVVGPDQLASMAEYQGIVAATNAVVPVKQKVDYGNNVYVIFTDPPLAYIGLNEAQAHVRYGHRLKAYRFDYATMRRALIDGACTGLAKFLLDGRGRLVGAHILGEAAPEVIHEAQVIKALKKPLASLNLVTHAYPTYAQALVGRSSQLAFLDKMSGNVFVRLALRLFPGLENRLNLARDRLAETPVPYAERTHTKIDVMSGTDAGSREHMHLKASYVDRDTCIVEVHEELTNHDERQLVAAMAWNDSREPRHVILDCSHVRRMNGLGASMLVKLSARAAAQGQSLSAFGLGEDLKQVFRVTDLDKAIRVCDCEATALLAVGVPVERISAQDDLCGALLANADNWAKPVPELFVPEMPPEARNLNVKGRRAVGPVNGFGRLCQKVFRLHLEDPSVSPEHAIAALKQNFPGFQPSFNRFYASARGIQPGAIVLIDSSTPGGPVSTGVMVLYADERSFTFNTPQGHPECGFVSFSSYEEQGGTVVEILGLARASDPMYEAAFRLVGSTIQTRIWTHVLTSLALHFGVRPNIEMEEECPDRSLRWAEARNIYHNAQIRTLINEPKRWFRSLQTAGLRE